MKLGHFNFGSTFVATAVAEKLAAMNAAAFFAERRERTDFTAFDRPDELIGRPKLAILNRIAALKGVLKRLGTTVST